jgi:hypothetical protein
MVHGLPQQFCIFTLLQRFFQGLLRQSASNHPPKDLSSLLDEIHSPADIDSYLWAKLFITHLEESDQKDVKDMFDFAVHANRLRTIVREPETCQDNLQISFTNLNLKRVEVCRLLFQCFFSSSANHPIGLSNQELRDELCTALTSIRENDTQETFKLTLELVWQARGDYRVWKGGLDKAYNIFLASKPTISKTASVLLTLM